MPSVNGCAQNRSTVPIVSNFVASSIKHAQKLFYQRFLEQTGVFIRMPSKKERQIREVMNEEKGRGKRSPATIDSKRRLNQFVAEYDRFMRGDGTKEELIAALKPLRPQVNESAVEKLLEEFLKTQ